MDGCGYFNWRPNWLQRFANSRWFMIVYGLLGTVQATSHLYFVVTLTTIEKRFKVPSQTTGIILSGNEISQILLSLILTYYGGQRNRPRWIAWGVVFSALSCFILACPHYIYGAGEEALQYTKEYSFNQNLSNILQTRPIDLKNNKLCKRTSNNSHDCGEVFTYTPLILIFMSQFVLGIGNTLYYSLGQSYIDDNTKRRNTPLVLAYAFAMRMFGPALGYGLAFLVLNIYIDPRYTPAITRDDPRWLGAYWLGWNFLGTLMLIFAGLIGLFPKNLPKKLKMINEIEIEGEIRDQKANIVENHGKKEKVELKNFPTALMRLLKNKLLIFNIISAIFYIVGSSGYITFIGRLMEVQFNRSSHGGSIFTGPITIIGTTIGLLTSGFVITKYKPAPRYLFLWNVIIGLVSMSAQVVYTQIGCNGGSSLMINGSVISCNVNCNCDDVSYSPVCDRSTGVSYFSPCHAGCNTFDEKAKVYRDCSCTKSITPEFELFRSEVAKNRAVKERSLSKFKVLNLDMPPYDYDDTDYENEIRKNSFNRNSKETRDSIKRKRRQSETNHVITPRACDSNCDSDFYIFSFISMISGFMGSTGRIGNVLLNFRAVENRDKSFSQGLSLFMISLFALIPGPIIFGRTIDSTCLIWTQKCGRRGNCQLYDPIKFRQYLHTTSAVCIFLGAFFDLLVWFYARNIELYGDDEPKKIQMELDNNESTETQPLNQQQLIEY